MQHKFRATVLSLFLAFVVCLSLTNVYVVLADDGTPTDPPPVQVTDAATEPPVIATDAPADSTPVPQEAISTPSAQEASPSDQAVVTEAATDQAPALNVGTDSQTVVSDLLAQVPDNTDVVVLDANGEQMPLASQDAADIIQGADPTWCPAGILPGGAGCHAFTNQSANNNLINLITDMKNNPGLYSQNGIIYMEKPGGNGFTTPLVLDSLSLGSSSFGILSGYDLTIRGGWNGSGTSTFSNQTNFGVNGGNQGYISIGSSSFPWGGSITLQDIVVTGVSNAPGVTVFTTGSNHNITLNNIDVASQSGTQYTALLNSNSGNIAIQNGSSFDGSTNGNNHSKGFSAISGSGSITITGTSGSRITFTDSDGNGDSTNYNGATLDAPIVTLNYVTATGNDLNGIEIDHANTVTLNNVTSGDNNNGNGTNPNGANNSLGSGVFVNGPTLGTVVTVNSGYFANNERYGIEIINGTMVTQTPPSFGTGNNSNGYGNTYVQTPVPPNTPPVLTLPGNMIVEATGPTGRSVSFTVTATDVEDNPDPTPTCSPASGSTFPIGNTTVNCSVTDSGGLTANGSFIVTVRDTTPPTLTLPSNITTEATGPSGRVVSFTATATDLVDGARTVTCLPASGSTFPIGTTIVNCSASDTRGNTASGFFSVIVRDTTPPALTLPSNITAEATSASGRVVSFTATATDLVDGTRPVTCSPNSGSTFPLGTTAVNCSATDTRGNTANGSFTVTVVDTTPPTIAAHANIGPIEATGGAGAVVAYTTPSATDLVDGTRPVTCSPASGAIFPIGTTTVNCSSSDTRGNTANSSFTVTVRDTTPPTLTLPSNITAEATSASGRVVLFSASATDLVDGARTVTCSPASGSTFPIGTTTVNCSASDSHGNASNGSFTITVVDTTPPTLTLPSNITAEAAGLSGSVVSFSATATDLVDGARIVTCLPASGSTFPIGTTTVNCSASDTRGNNASGSFTVTVRDTTPPTMTLPSNITVEATGPAGRIVSFTASATDLVDGTRPVTCSPASGNTFPIGTTTVNCSASDTRGNTANGSFSVTVQDTTPPTLTLPSNITAEATGSSGSAVSFSASATDLVDGARTVTCSPASGSTFPIGTTTVNCSASDTRGNTANGSFTVTVRDTTPPTIAAQVNIGPIEATSGAGAVVGYTAPSTSDIVDGAGTATCSPASGATFPLGSTTVTCNATDAHGNHATPTTFTVTVVDTTPPTIAVHASIFDTTDVKGAVITYTNPTTFDIVDGVGIANCSPASGSNFKVGDTVVTCHATDSHGNAATPITFMVYLDRVKRAGQTPGTGNSSIAVTGGNNTNIACTNPANYNLVSEGIYVSFNNLCNYQSVMNSQAAVGLPGILPDGASFLQGLTVNILKDGGPVNPLPSGASITIAFPIPDGQENTNLVALFWNGSQWVEVTGQKSSDGFFKITSTQPGTFLMLSK